MTRFVFLNAANSTIDLNILEPNIHNYYHAIDILLKIYHSNFENHEKEILSNMNKK